jgi:hypothetical protein
LTGLNHQRPTYVVSSDEQCVVTGLVRRWHVRDLLLGQRHEVQIGAVMLKNAGHNEDQVATIPNGIAAPTDAPRLGPVGHHCVIVGKALQEGCEGLTRRLIVSRSNGLELSLADQPIGDIHESSDCSIG